MTYPYTSLSQDDKAGIEVSLQASATSTLSDKVVRALEADHYARTLLGMDTKNIEQLIDKYRKKTVKP